MNDKPIILESSVQGTLGQITFRRNAVPDALVSVSIGDSVVHVRPTALIQAIHLMEVEGDDAVS